VGQRIAEIGVRMTLGATPRSVMALVLRQGAVLIFGGLAIGTAAALATSGVMSSLVFGVATTDTVSYVAAAVGLGLVTLSATLLPAWRAAQVDPVVALRHE
jgi:ABC-type antimicrobial peptide transport system permease subunit